MVERLGIVKPRVEIEIEKLLSEGERWSVIAKTLRVSNRTISKVAKRMSEPFVPPPPASQVFTMFEKGTSPMEIVKESNANPVEIEKWFEAWLEMNKNWRKWKEFQRARASADKDGKEIEKEHKRPDWKRIIEDKLT